MLPPTGTPSSFPSTFPAFSSPARKFSMLRFPALTWELRSSSTRLSSYLRRNATEFWKTSGALPAEAWVLNFFQKFS